MQTIDKLSYQSRWRYVDPRLKFLLYICFMVLAMSLPPTGQAVLLLVIAVLTCYLLKVGPLRYLKWLSLPLGFLVIGVVAIVISFSRQADVLLYSLHIGSFYIGVDPVGLVTANQTFWRSLASLAATFWFMFNMPFEQLIKLLRWCRVPLLLMEQILLIWRFIFIFLEEAVAIYHAQELRFGYRSLRTSYHSFAMLVTMLFARVMSRYQQMSIALEVKLYQGNFHL